MAQNEEEEERMAIGPVQLLAIGFDSPDFEGEVVDELSRLRDIDAVKVIDALVVYKNAEGDMAVLSANNLSEDESVELGAKVGALVGLGADGEQGFSAGAQIGAAAGEEGLEVFSGDTALDLLEAIPNDSAVALVLIEHHWAVPLRDAVVRAGGFQLGGRFISPLDLVRVGLASREEAEELAALEEIEAEEQ
jgi:uncharacterized membrane protein